MKKLIVLMSAVVVLSTTASAVSWDEKSDRAFAEFERAFVRQIKADADEAAKIDFSGLENVMVSPVKSKLKQMHPQFTRMVYLGQIGEEGRRDWSAVTSTNDKWYYYYFVVTEQDVDYFYTAVRHYNYVAAGLTSTEDGYDTLFPMGAAAYDPTVSKKTLEDLKSTLRAPFDKQLKEVLKGVALSTIESIKIQLPAHSYKVKGNKYTDYTLVYTLKNGETFRRKFTYAHASHLDYGYGGSSQEAMVTLSVK